jgi:hypothetical protein
LCFGAKKKAEALASAFGNPLLPIAAYGIIPVHELQFNGSDTDDAGVQST